MVEGVTLDVLERASQVLDKNRIRSGNRAGARSSGPRAEDGAAKDVGIQGRCTSEDSLLLG